MTGRADWFRDSLAFLWLPAIANSGMIFRPSQVALEYICTCRALESTIKVRINLKKKILALVIFRHNPSRVKIHKNMLKVSEQTLGWNIGKPVCFDSART